MSAAGNPTPTKVTAPSIKARKVRGGSPPITALTAYDHPTARLVDEAGIDVLLVGDSLGPNVLGYDSTLPVTLDEMLHHGRAVRRAVRHALVVGDLPFGCYHASVEDAVRAAVRFVKDGGAESVKLEGGGERAPAIRAVVDAGIPVMAHIGLRPQAMHAMGGFKVQGKAPEEAEHLLQDADAVVAAGAFAIVLEGIPASLAAQITARVPVPTIGIGAGKDCDGQILVFSDVVGFTSVRPPKFVRRYADVNGIVRDALAKYVADVVGGTFPNEAESYGAAKPAN